MENEIIEEVDLESVNQNVNDSELVDSVEEDEGINSYTQDELVSALLHLINEQKNLDQEYVVDDDPEAFLIEEAPLMVQSVDNIDYSEQLTALNNKLDSLISITEEASQPLLPDTPLNQYSLENLLLLGVLFVLGFTFAYQFIKDNLLHF